MSPSLLSCESLGRWQKRVKRLAGTCGHYDVDVPVRHLQQCASVREVLSCCSYVFVGCWHKRGSLLALSGLLLTPERWWYRPLPDRFVAFKTMWYTSHFLTSFGLRHRLVAWLPHSDMQLRLRIPPPCIACVY